MSKLGLFSFFLRGRKSQRGVSAVEFALIAPVMLLMVFGASEASLAVSINRKVTLASSTIADLVTQNSMINCSELTEMMSVSRNIFAPYSGTPANFAIAHVTISGGLPKVQWSKMVNAAGACVDAPSMPVGSTISIGGNSTTVANLIETGGGIIVGEVTYNYQSIGTSFFANSVNMNERFYLRPRISSTVCFDTNTSVAGCQ